MSKFQVYKSAVNNQYYYRLRASNGEIVQSSEGYIAKASCLKGIESVKHNCVLERFAKFYEAKQYGFNQKAANGEIIGRSEKYTTSAGRDHGIEVVIQEAPNAPIEDIT